MTIKPNPEKKFLRGGERHKLDPIRIPTETVLWDNVASRTGGTQENIIEPHGRTEQQQSG